MDAPDDIWIERFNARILAWATECFVEELRSDFERIRCFDSARSREMLLVLRGQPAEQLRVLAKVLPLGVFWEHPDDIHRRNKLPREEREAVEMLRADYNQEYLNHFNEHVQRLASRQDKGVKEQFNLASRKGNQIIKEIASQWKCEVATAALGEWGLIFKKDWLRIVISLHLARHMELGYTVSMSNLTGSRSIRFHDTYVGLLGFGVGQWDVETANQFPEKFRKASEFARWHVQEYEKLLVRMDGGLVPGS